MFIVRGAPTGYGDVWGLKRKECPGGGCLELERQLVPEVGVWGPSGGPFVDVPNTLSLVFTEAGSLGRGDILKFTFLKGCVGCRYIGRTSWGGAREEGRRAQLLGQKMLALIPGGRGVVRSDCPLGLCRRWS